MKICQLFSLVILTISTSFFGYCQQYYNSIYGDQSLFEFAWEIHLKNNANLIQLSTRKEIDDSLGLSLTQITIREIDIDIGSLLWEDFIANDSLNYYVSGKHSFSIIDSILYIVDKYQQVKNGELFLSLPYFGKYDLKNQKLLEIKYFSGEKLTFLNSLIFHQEYFYGVGFLNPFDGYIDRDCFMIKMDMEGNLIWQKTFDFGQDEQMFEIEAFQDDLLVTGYHTNDYWTKSFVIQLDTAGNELNRAEPEYFGGSGTFEVEIHNDQIYFLTKVNEEVETFHTQYLASYDAELNLQWDTLIPNTSRYHIDCRRMEILNDEIIIASNIRNARAFTNNQLWSHAASWSLDGDFNWEHVYFYDSTFLHHIDDIEALPNGDLIFMGTVFDNINTTDIWGDQYLWLFRTDSQGCGTVQDTCYYTLDEYFGLDTMVNVFDFPLMENKLVEILGNPFSEQLLLQPKTNQVLDMIIYNVQGQLVYEGLLSGTAQLNTSHWQSGIYVLQLLDDGQLVGLEKLVRK